MSKSTNSNPVTIKSRFIHKHDTEANWKLATNFAPLLGEIIVYDPDETYTYPRYKVGIWDGKSEKTAAMIAANLPFANEGTETTVVSNVAVEHTSVNQDAYTVDYDATTSCLCFSPATVQVVPELTVATKVIYEAPAPKA